LRVAAEAPINLWKDGETSYRSKYITPRLRLPIPTFRTSVNSVLINSALLTESVPGVNNDIKGMSLSNLSKFP
jgi:hypothetical protein